nr:unnamed protein product [Digitaria exilis]CAB3501496.1 unnamed protein product [Digitaria exilis]
MITRAKLAEQLREHQIRSAQSYSAALAVFSPSPHIASRYAHNIDQHGMDEKYGTISYAKSVVCQDH